MKFNLSRGLSLAFLFAAIISFGLCQYLLYYLNNPYAFVVFGLSIVCTLIGIGLSRNIK